MQPKQSSPVRKKKEQIIAFCGTRGIPANYGGFETAVDEITNFFVANGYDCEVFCRRSAQLPRHALPDRHEGRTLVYVSGSKSRKLDTFISSIQTGWYLWRHRRRYAFVFWFNNANFPGIVMTLLARIPMAVNTDGLEWRRAKWSWPFKLYYLITSFLICRLCRNLISDAVEIKQFYRKWFLKRTIFIPNGARLPEYVTPEAEGLILENYGLARGRYFLQITRFEPDNLPLELAVAFSKVGLHKDGFKLVLVGYRGDTEYSRRVKACDGKDGIVILDATYDQRVLTVLRKNCFCYAHGNSVGGTNPALLEAMAVCPRIMAIDVPFSREVLGGHGLYFKKNDIEPVFKRSLAMEDETTAYRERISSFYCWEKVAESYLRVVQGKVVDYV